MKLVDIWSAWVREDDVERCDNLWSRFVETTAIGGAEGNTAVMYAAMSLSGEAGEAVEHIKKNVWKTGDIGPVVDQERRYKLQDELSDVLWAITRLANLHGWGLNDLQCTSMEKLVNRHEEQGTGR